MTPSTPSLDASAVPAVPAGAPVPQDQSATIDETLQVLFSCCLSLCRAARDGAHEDDLIQSTIEDLDRAIRLLRSTAAPLV